ncbi:unnamed protein product [Thlaspi arvense]|uniref:F-box protein n=1 Tax=Thlaspi arvense TaxID=13288 RepID=A0AAU9SXD9_THLAR|nr:unnamed protein product [Thlaspi arvense]
MDAPNTKRPRHDVTSSLQNPNSLPISSQSHFDLIISSLLSFSSDSSPSLLSSPPSIGRSFDRALEKALASNSADVSVQDRLVDRTVELASLLLESTQRCFRKRASVHNSNSWSFPQELTVKMFSMLDKKSLMRAMACCTMFHKCAMEPLCYSHIELRERNVDDGVVRTMIHRAGKELRSLELGHAASPVISPKSLLTESCLSPLSFNHCFIGNRLRSLHLYDLIHTYENSSVAALSACSNITDLKIVGMSCDQLFESLPRKSCRMIEHLFLETSGFPHSSIRDSGLVEFVTNIPNLTSLTLIGFGVNDSIAQTLVEGSRKLNYMNLSRTLIKGRFLRDLEQSFKDSPLETLILRDCNSLEEKEVSQFLNSLFTGNLSFIRHIDVSNIRGLVCDGGKRSKKPNLPLEKLKEERSNVKFMADFTSSLSRSEMLLRGISYDSDEEDGWAINPGFESDDDIGMADFVVDQDFL